MRKIMRQLAWLLALGLLMGSLTACEQRNPARLKSTPWRLSLVTPKQTLIGVAKFTDRQVIVTDQQRRSQHWRYYFNDDDDLVIQDGCYAGTYVMQNIAKDFQLVPIIGSTQTLKIQQLKK